MLKEWEIHRDSVNLKPDISFLARYEKKIGRPYLWNAIVADRRIFLGRKYSYSQDYAPRFNHERMLAILQVALQRVEKLFDELEGIEHNLHNDNDPYSFNIEKHLDITSNNQ